MADINQSDIAAPHRQLPTAVQLQVLSLLPPNDLALSGRLAFRGARDTFSGTQHCTASMSEPLPPHAASCAVEAGQQRVRQLPFWQKLHLLCTAAASGSEVNLEVALEVLQPSIFPDLLQLPMGELDDRVAAARADRWSDSRYNDAWSERRRLYDPGQAAIEAGHLHLLGWLVRRCPALLQPRCLLEAAARHCSLAGLQEVYELVKPHIMSSSSSSSNSISSGAQHMAIRLGCGETFLDMGPLEAAAASPTPDAVAKMEWLLSVEGARCSLNSTTAVAAVRSGDIGRLRWLRGRGCPMGGQLVMVVALEQDDLAVAEWLVDEAGFELPKAGVDECHWMGYYKVAARVTGGVAKMRWLQERGAPPLDSDMRALHDVVRVAIMGGQVDVVSYLLSTYGKGKILAGDPGAYSAMAASSQSIPMAERLRLEGVQPGPEALETAMQAWDVDTARWLMQETGASSAGPVLPGLRTLVALWPSKTPADNRNLLRAVRRVLDAGLGEWGPLDGRLWEGVVNRGDPALVLCLLEQQRQQEQQQEQQPHQQAGSWSSDVSRCLAAAAAKAGCEALMELLATAPGGLASPAASLYTSPAARGDRATLTALRRLGVPWGVEDVVVQAALQGSQAPALRWLVEQGAPVGSARDVQAAAEKAVHKWGFGAADADWLRGLAA